jgi:NtrC-family two-component system sensor histidine kinase KinB
MLRTRLFLNLLPFVVILLATGVYAIVLFSRLAYRLDQSVTERYRSVVAVQQMMRTLTGIELETWTASWPGNPPNPASESRKYFEQHLALQLRNTSIPGMRGLNEQLAAKYQAFCVEADSLKGISETADRLRVYKQQITPNLLAMNNLLDRILELNQQAILPASAQVRGITWDVTRLMILGMVISLAIVGHAFYQLSRSVLRPIQRVTEATRELGEGNLNQVVPDVSRDELGELARAFNKMAAQLQEYRHSTTEEIVRLHRTMETTLGSFPDPIFVLNQQGSIELKNPAADVLSRELDPPNELPSRLQTLTRKVLQSGEDFLPHSFKEVISYRVGGAEKFYLPRILTMRSKENSLFGVAVVLYDVTRFRLLDSAKTHLVGTVSHELKTPLTSVRMVIHILLEKAVGTLSPKQEELLVTARNDTERLLGILDNLLDLARLEEGDAELRREDVAPADLIRVVLEETADQVVARGLKINCALDAGLPLVSVDRTRISHVFTNLVTNAIKHSPPGGEIILRAARSDDHSVLFTVTDEGRGIPTEYQTRIFDRFFRVPGQTKTGAGLGLSIAREITVAHGGRIGVKSSPGEGASFYVTLKAVDESESR